MKIVDLRKEKYLDIDIKSHIEKILAHAPKELIQGLNKITIIDSDYKKRAHGRYIPNFNGSNEIELMLDSMDDYPEELLAQDLIFTFEIGKILFHELYHHKNSFLNRRTPKKERDEQLANDFGLMMIKNTIKKIYSDEELKTLITTGNAYIAKHSKH